MWISRFAKNLRKKNERNKIILGTKCYLCESTKKWYNKKKTKRSRHHQFACSLWKKLKLFCLSWFSHFFHALGLIFLFEFWRKIFILFIKEFFFFCFVRTFHSQNNSFLSQPGYACVRVPVYNRNTIQQFRQILLCSHQATCTFKPLINYVECFILSHDKKIIKFHQRTKFLSMIFFLFLFQTKE